MKQRYKAYFQDAPALGCLKIKAKNNSVIFSEEYSRSDPAAMRRRDFAEYHVFISFLNSNLFPLRCSATATVAVVLV